MGCLSNDRFNEAAEDWDNDNWHNLVNHAIKAGLDFRDAVEWAEQQNPYRAKTAKVSKASAQPELFPSAT